MRMSAAISPDRTLFTCWEDFSGCRKYELDPKRLFAPSRHRGMIQPGEESFVRDIVGRSLHTGSEAVGDWKLVATGEDVPLIHPRIEKGQKVPVFSSQYLSVKAGTRVSVDLDMELHGEGALVQFKQRSAAVAKDEMPTGMDFVYYMNSEKEREKAGLSADSKLGMRPRFYNLATKLFQKRFELGHGERATLRYHFDVVEDMERLNCGLYAWVRAGEAPTLRFTRAQLRLEPLGDREPGEPQVQVAQTRSWTPKSKLPPQ